MIVPMIKYGFLVYHADFDPFLNRLQELGMVDIEKHDRPLTEGERALVSKINIYSNVIKELKNAPVKPDIPRIEGEIILDELIAEFDNLAREKEQIDASIRKAQKDLGEVKPWGNFNINLLKKLNQSGIKIRFFITGEKAFNEAELDEVTIETINVEAGQVYFVWIQHDGDEQPETLPLDAVEVRVPTFSALDKEKEIMELRGRISQIEYRIDQMRHHVDAIEASKNDLLNLLEFNSVNLSAERQADEKVMILEGWVPEPQNEEFVKFIDNENIIYVSEKAKKDDNAPILLKNNKFSKLFEVIGGLFTNPIYGEIDLTPLFAPFFMLFFGMCLGDAGYGLFLLLVATIAKPKLVKMKPILSLVQWLGLATAIFGTLSGSFFGMELASINIPIIQRFKDVFLDQNQLFALALIVGVIQILFAMFVKAANEIKQWGWIHSITTFSWLLLIIGSIVFYGLSTMEGSSVEFMGLGHKILLGIAGIGIMFFNTPGKNPFINFGLGLWGIYNMITGLFGDILSYIRLFALGLSGAILGGVFNSLAFGMAPDIPVVGAIVTIIILVAGHSINLFMNALGALVHPMRLTFVEFYKNAGFTGGGKSYEPFRKKN